MEYYNDILCISYDELTRNDAAAGGECDAIMSRSNYLKLANKGEIDVVRQGKGKNNYALIAFDSLPERFKARAKEKYPDAMKMILVNYLNRYYVLDVNARAYYANEVRTSNGSPLPLQKQKELTVNASVLNALKCLMEDRPLMVRSMNGTMHFEDIVYAMEYFRTATGHTLPSSRLRAVLKKYVAESYGALVSGKINNQNTRKVTFEVEQLIINLAGGPKAPYVSTVSEQFDAFMAGDIDVVDTRTGEFYDRKKFFKNDRPLTLSAATIWNIMNNPKNKILIEHVRQDWTSFNHSQRPHVHRHAPFFAFSKISLDDRDLPRQTHQGLRPKAYYAYDVCSGCVVGYAFSRKKDTMLFVECLRNMFRLIARNGWCAPAEAEVETHLVNQFADTVMKANEVFSFVRWCVPTNSREKHAEPLHRSKKYSVEKKNHIGIGRWWAKLDANRTYDKKIFDEQNNNYIAKKTYDFDELVADDIADIYEYNHMLHPNQARYPGMTRWQVLCENMNPSLKPLDNKVLMRYIGESCETSVRSNSYIRVQYKNYWLSSPDVLARMKPGKTSVTAYYLPDDEGKIDEVYIYQGDRYIDTCRYIGTFNESAAERTEQDVEIMTAQQKYIAQFDKLVKDNRIAPAEVITADKKEAVAQAMAAPVALPDTPDDDTLMRLEPEEEFDYSFDYSSKALDDL